MTFRMKRFGQAPRRGRPRWIGQGSVSCELLESRQLLSTGVQMGNVAGGVPSASLGEWGSQWADLATLAESPVGTGQIVTNLGNDGLGAGVEVTEIVLLLALCGIRAPLLV